MHRIQKVLNENIFWAVRYTVRESLGFSSVSLNVFLQVIYTDAYRIHSTLPYKHYGVLSHNVTHASKHNTVVF